MLLTVVDQDVVDYRNSERNERLISQKPNKRFKMITIHHTRTILVFISARIANESKRVQLKGLPQ